MIIVVKKIDFDGQRFCDKVWKEMRQHLFRIFHWLSCGALHSSEHAVFMEKLEK